MSTTAIIASLGGIEGIVRSVITVVSGGLAGAILTLITKSITDRRNRKVLLVKTIVESFSDSLPGTATTRPKEIRVSYSGSEYDNLARCMITLTNLKKASVSDISLLLDFPENTQIINRSHTCEPSAVVVSENSRSDMASSRLIYDIDRLESRDAVSFLLTVNCPNLDKIKIRVRGLPDDVEVVRDMVRSEGSMDYSVRMLILFSSLFILGSIIPYNLGTLLQVSLILLFAKHIYRVIITIISHFGNTVSNDSVSLPAGAQLVESPAQERIEISKSEIRTPRDIVIPAYRQKCSEGVSLLYYTSNQRAQILSLFAEKANIAKNGKAIASSQYQDRHPSNIFLGERSGDAWTLDTNPGWLEATWTPSISGRYLVLINRTSNLLADPWGKASLFLNDNALCGLKYDFSGSSVLVVDFSREVDVSKLRFEINGQTYPGLAGLELHKENG